MFNVNITHTHIVLSAPTITSKPSSKYGSYGYITKIQTQGISLNQKRQIWDELERKVVRAEVSTRELTEDERERLVLPVLRC